MPILAILLSTLLFILDSANVINLTWLQILLPILALIALFVLTFILVLMLTLIK